MANARIYGYADTHSSEDDNVYMDVDKSGFTNAEKVLYSTFKGWFKVGDQQYTEENYVTNDETLTASIDALDQQVKDNADDIAASSTTLHQATVTCSAADVLSLYAIPKAIIAAQGANTYIDIISIKAFNDYDSSAYVASTNKLVLRYDGESTGLYEWSNAFIESAADLMHKGVISSNVIMKANTKVELFIENANPTAGDGTITIYVLYSVTTVS